MNLSSASLFHFTNNLDNIVNILKDGYYWPIYCPEVDKVNKDQIHAYAFPMVCFCDIPLSQTTEHTNDYGYYAIAMSKVWAKNKGVSPVLYYSGTESLAMRLFRRNESVVSKKDKVLWLSMLKKIYGKTWSWKENGYRNKTLYNEREWRFIPQNIPLKELFMNVAYKDFQGRAASNNTRKYGLSFSYSDIRYIILKEDKEREEFLIKVKGVISDEVTQKLLSSKLLTFEQIKEDF